MARVGRLTYFWYVIAAFCGAGLLSSLACWQAQRLIWKKSIIAAMHCSTKEPLMSVEEMLKNRPAENSFRRVHIAGQWVRGTNLFVSGKIHHRRPGYYLFRIVTLENGENLLVNIGWVEKTDMTQQNVCGADFVGRVRVPDEKRWFMPAHQSTKREWAYVDIQDMAQTLGIYILPIYVDYMRPDTGTPPHPMPDIIPVSNNHLGYVVTWACLALVWLSIFVILAMRKRREYENDHNH